jgi:hypothetical protein
MAVIIQNNLTIMGGFTINKPVVSSGGVSASDALYAQLTTSRAAYTAATVNSWIVITSTEYASIFSNVQGMQKRGNTDIQVATRAISAGFNEVTFGTTDINTPLTINTGEYPIAFVSETWNSIQNVQFGYTTIYHSGTPTYGNSVVINPSQRNYYLRKAPTGIESAPATQTLYPTLKLDTPTFTFNTVPSTVGWYTTNGGASWASYASGMAKFQMLVTSAKTW